MAVGRCSVGLWPVSFAALFQSLACAGVLGAALTGCGSGGGSGGGTNTRSAALHSGTMMFIGAQLEVYGNTVEWADVDGDGYLDLISSVGDSGIGTEETYVASGSLNEIIGRPRLVFNASEGAIADFNGDGLLDLVGALGTDDSSLESFAAISLQNSNGTFGPPSNLGIPTFLLFGWGYAACDVDGNGVADLLINISIDGYSAGTAVLMGRGDGKFDRL